METQGKSVALVLAWVGVRRRRGRVMQALTFHTFSPFATSLTAPARGLVGELAREGGLEGEERSGAGS